MKYYKVLDENMRSYNGGDAQWTLWEWMPSIEGELVPCGNGYHVCTMDQLPQWLGPRIFEVEVGEETVNDGNKTVVRDVRITRETGWNDRTARLFACDCAEHVLPLFEAEHSDDRPRRAIETARDYAVGEATEEELAAARTAAWAAARTAARAAARTAARSAARSAARAAARSAARAAAWATAEYAADAVAWAAARAAAEYAADADAWTAARAAAGDAEKLWQTGKLEEYLGGGE